MACALFDATPITSNPSRRSRSAAPSRKRALSSTIRHLSDTSEGSTITCRTASPLPAIFRHGELSVGLDRLLKLEVERQLGDDLRSRVGPTVEPERAAERLDSVVEADDPRAACCVNSADAVVANRQQQAALAPLERNVNARCLRMLSRVGESLGRNEVRRHLDRLREPPLC